MAGMPAAIVNRSTEILHKLESQRESMNGKKQNEVPVPSMQLKLFEYDDPTAAKLREEMQKLDINTLTPVEALMKLNYLKSIVEKEK